MADKQFDISPQEFRNLEEKAKHRAALKQEYLKQISNPHRHASMEGGTVFDAGVQRFMALKTRGYDNFRATPKSAATGFGLCILPIIAYTWWIKNTRDAQEHKYRTGQVAYKDRRFKFI